MGSVYLTTMDYQKLHHERVASLRPKLTDEFLATLVEASEVSMSDYIEIDSFIHELFEIAGKERRPQPDVNQRTSQT